MTNNNNKNSIPANVTSYDTGNKPFKHDVGRGKWEKSWDFYAVALSNCFGFRHFTLLYITLRSNLIIFTFAYMLGMITFLLPLYYTQMFLGQFSSSGIISAFRISPLFKVIGYISLYLNIMTSCYFVTTAAFPLYIIIESMQSVLPWSHCNNEFNSINCKTIDDVPKRANESSIFLHYNTNHSLPIHDYIDYLFGYDTQNIYLWPIMLCAVFVWILIGLVHIKGVEMLGKIFRFITLTSFLCFILITIRVLCVKETWEALNHLFHFKFASFNNIETLIASPTFFLAAFGAGWGNVLTIASYNNFKEDIGKLSLVACFIQMIVFIISAIIYKSVDKFLRQYYLFTYMYFGRGDPMLFTFVCYAGYFSHFSWPNFWTILFFLVIFLTQFSEGAIQILTILTAIFDEYEYTRIYKRIFLGGLIGFLALISLAFCSSDVFASVFSLYSISGANKLLIVLMELFVVLWIYGRLRFQRDVKFMTEITLKSWKIWMMRFVTPFLTIVSLLYHVFQGFFFSNYISIFFIFIFLKLLPLICIPGYMIYKVYAATGGILDRIRKLCRPTDWFPADPIEHQNYEHYLGNSDICNELVHDNFETSDTNHI
ncbi:sodium-dependent neutral amino acid transporter SLC6A17-like [Condylostylus longicornis]|uniref:sodium-dependent neutral amino acid transporter SLC6A17-like n=1 Tax=Condylostylus longicornis TaxID=2530218 RepID=UPI00244DC3A3|nr:sodium-dependent neutral amino acid transporter SLC6A17-like [Condylostylus longicornis]